MANAAMIIEKIHITGTLQTCSPLRIGAGGMQDNHDVDTYILKDKNDVPFIPGTSLAGVLRAYMNALHPDSCPYLFGDLSINVQSAVRIDDVPLENAKIVVRDGVRIDSYTHTAVHGAKYNYEALERGASGRLSMEITLRRFQEEHIPISKIHEALTDLLLYMEHGFQAGSLTAKGFGKVKLCGLETNVYDMTDAEDIKAWVLKCPSGHHLHKSGAFVPVQTTFVVEADFALKSSLIIRDYNIDEMTAGGGQISAVQKKSRDSYVIPGTSLKGVLRHEAEAILRRMGKTESDVAERLNRLMGFSDEETKAKAKSRFIVEEVYFGGNVVEKEQSRNRIDRFTGGTIDTALFTTKPVWQKEKNARTLSIHYEIQRCSEWEAGLALYILRSLWLGRCALGGEKSIGRGTLQGLGATISFEGETYKLDKDGNVVQGDKELLNMYASTVWEC